MNGRHSEFSWPPHCNVSNLNLRNTKLLYAHISLVAMIVFTDCCTIDHVIGRADTADSEQEHKT